MRHWIDFAAVKAAAQFEPILMRYELGLEKQGRELVGRCPFHEDDKPSFSVNPTKNVFHCFGCGAKGNLLDFVAKMEDVPIRKAAEMVAEWLGIEGVAHVPARTLQRRRGLRRKASSEARPAHVDAIARDGEGNDGSSVADSNQALAFALKLDASHSYLAERGVDAETARHFGVGFCERGMFGGRIAIPIHNAAGELVGYLGRWPGETLPGGEKRYKLPPAFKKNDVLYNLHRVRGTEHVVIVEGAWSVFRLHALGYSAVALLGCSLSERQEALLSDLGATRVSVLLDGDQAGRAAAMEIVRRISRHGFVRLLDLPDGAQPDTVDEGVLARLLA